jgi:hypothetical protein
MTTGTMEPIGQIEHRFKLKLPSGAEVEIAGAGDFVRGVYDDVKTAAVAMARQHAQLAVRLDGAAAAEIQDQLTATAQLPPPLASPTPTIPAIPPTTITAETPPRRIVRRRRAAVESPVKPPAEPETTTRRRGAERLVQIITPTGKPLKPMSLSDAVRTLTMAESSIKQMCTPSGQKKGGRTRTGFTVHYVDQPAPAQPASDSVRWAIPGLGRITRPAALNIGEARPAHDGTAGPINPNARIARGQGVDRDSEEEFPDDND